MASYSSLNRSSPEKIREWEQRSRDRALAREREVGRGERILPKSRLRAKPLPDDEKERRRLIRREVWQRDRRCLLYLVPGAGECFGGPTYHHRRKDGQGGAYSVANGATLCAGHNSGIEADADLSKLAESLDLVVRRGHPEWEALGR